jgi:Pilus assembly protein, PilO
VKKKPPVPKWAPVALVGVGALVVLAAGWVLLLAPKQSEIGSLHKQAAMVQQQIAADLSRAGTARTATGAPKIRVADIYKLQLAMPSSPDMPDLLLELDQAAKAAGVQLTSLGPGQGTAAAGGNYTTIPISLAASGNFYGVTDLLYRLRNLVYVRGGALEANGPIFSVNSVTLSPVGKLVTADISLTTYVFGTSAAVGSSTVTPTPGSTTSTDTTQTTTTSSGSGPAAAGVTP